jgi:hypothetical protein
MNEASSITEASLRFRNAIAGASKAGLSPDAIADISSAVGLMVETLLALPLPADASQVSQARAEGRREGQIAERERMQRKEMRRAVTWLHGFAAQMNDPHAKQVINLAADEYGRETAAAIRALAQKEPVK